MTTEITNEYFPRVGFGIEPAPVDAWRQFNEEDPVPGYFQFDWFSARHPDLYHRFALSTEGLLDELEKMVDLSGLIVADIGAGTGRATLRLARKARQVFAIDAYRSVLDFNRRLTESAGLRHVTYLVDDRTRISLPENAVDAAIAAWAYMDYREAYRITRPGGYVIFMAGAPGALCGELTALLAPLFPEAIDAVAPAEVFDPAYPTRDCEVEGRVWNDVPLAAPLRVRDFTYVTDYGDWTEAAAILGRLYGPKAKAYIQERAQSTISWRLRIEYCRTAK